MILKIILIAAVLVILYAAAENLLVFSTRHEGECGKLKVMQISDIHKKRGKKIQKKIIRCAEKEKPDVIFITGDLVSRTETDFLWAENLLKSLCLTAPVYMCMGNHEQSLPEKMQKEFFEAVKRTDVRLLVNEWSEITAHGEKYNVCGIEIPYTAYKKNGGYSGLDDFTAADLTACAGEVKGGKTILLAHNPLFAESYAGWGADYTFSGHIHGGSVRIFGKGILSPERKFFPEYAKGVYSIKTKGGNPKEMKLFVSAGIGKPRMFNPSEIVVYLI